MYFLIFPGPWDGRGMCRRQYCATQTDSWTWAGDGVTAIMSFCIIDSPGHGDDNNTQQAS